MDRTRLNQYIEYGLVKRAYGVNIRRKLPPPNSHPAMEDLSEYLADALSIVKEKSRSNDVSIDDFTSRDFFFDLDSYYRLHEQLLKDREYMSSWHSAICSNPHLFKDKIVLDVRCGMGVLSMFAAIAGAKHVYAIDKSDIIQLTRRIVRDNRLTNKISIIQGSAADIDLPVTKVDIIISTSFVTSIYYDNSFDEIIMARDKWLTSGGLMFPDRCTLYIAAIQDQDYSRKNAFWRDVYGFDMSPMYAVVNLQPAQSRIRSSKMITDFCPFKQINFYEITKGEWEEFAVVFRLKVDRDSDDITALFTFFEVEFTKCHRPVTISTRPGSKLENWLPTIFYLNATDMVPVHRKDEVYGSLVFNGKNKQKATIRIDLCYRNRSGFLREKFLYEFR